MRYFRTYPWGMQVVMFVSLWFALAWGAGVIIPGFLPKLTGYSVSQVEGITPDSPPSLIQAAIVVQGLLSLFVFFLPAFLFAYLSHPSPSGYLGLKPPGKKIQWLLVALMMIGATPVLNMMEGLMSLINFGPKIKALQEENDNVMGAFLKMPTTLAFIRVFIVAAILPALGEEMFFRGVLMRFVKKRTRNMAIPILFSALVFAGAHGNIYGLPSIFIAGILLAVIYYLTGSLWCSIFGHLLFNGLQIILSFAGNYSATLKTFNESNSVPFSIVGGGAIIFTLSFYLLLKNKTPLTANWTDDFSPEELPGFDYGGKK